MIIEFVRSKKVEKPGFVRGCALGGPDGEWPILIRFNSYFDYPFFEFPLPVKPSAKFIPGKTDGKSFRGRQEESAVIA